MKRPFLGHPVLNDRILLPFAMVYALGGLAYLLSKSVFNTDADVDLKYIWVAGQLWSEGINPYSDSFSEIGNNLFENTNALATFVYPPNWWLISSALASFEFDTAVIIWRSFNAGLIAGGIWLLRHVFSVYFERDWRLFTLLFFGFAATMQATPTVLSMGQTSILLFFGVCALFNGLARRSAIWVVVGLICVALKPNVGLIFWAGLVAFPTQWRAIVVAAMLTLLLSLPGFIVVGAEATLRGLIDGYLSYGDVDVNSPASTTGLRHLVNITLGIEMSAITLVLFGSVAAFMGSIALNRLEPAGHDAQLQRNLPVWLLLVVMTFVALHSYDLIIAVPLLLVCFSGYYPAYFRATVALGMLLLYRSSNIARVTGFENPDTLYHAGSLIDSIVAVVITIVFVTFAISRRSRIAPAA